MRTLSIYKAIVVYELQNSRNRLMVKGREIRFVNREQGNVSPTTSYIKAHEMNNITSPNNIVIKMKWTESISNKY